MSERIRKAGRRYTLEFGGAMTLYVVVLLASVYAAKEMEQGPMLTALALAPIAPVILACIAFFRFYVNMDERERRIHADAAAFSLVIGIFAALTLGFLHTFGVFKFEWDMLWFGPFLIALWGIVRCIIKLRD